MSHEETERAISGHYGPGHLIERIEEALRQYGLDPRHVTVTQLAPLDNFHSFGLAGTLELARLAAITSGDRVLDVGGGVGGPARQLASRFGCHVTVLDLTPEFCAVGETLTTWTHLSERVSFVQGNALALPFADGSFDVAWTQHASMNIPDKARLYSEVARVVRPGGRFALFDILAGPTQPIHFPVPWAVDPSYSFLAMPDEARAAIAHAGFRELTWIVGRDLTDRLQSPDASSEGVPPATGLNLNLLLGEEGPVRMANAQRNGQEGRSILAMGVFERI